MRPLFSTLALFSLTQLAWAGIHYSEEPGSCIIIGDGGIYGIGIRVSSICNPYLCNLEGFSIFAAKYIQ
jgi:hypothetical protein